jgi:hypothetical protein
MTKSLFAIFKNGEHKGNERGATGFEAISAYIVASDLVSFVNDENFRSEYSARLAINGVDHHYVKGLK